MCDGISSMDTRNLVLGSRKIVISLTECEQICWKNTPPYPLFVLRLPIGCKFREFFSTSIQTIVDDILVAFNVLKQVH